MTSELPPRWLTSPGKTKRAPRCSATPYTLANRAATISSLAIVFWKQKMGVSAESVAPSFSTAAAVSYVLTHRKTTSSARGCQSSNAKQAGGATVNAP